MSIGDFLDGLQGLQIDGVNMLAAVPVEAPSPALLPVSWLDLPTIIGQPPTTMMNSAIRPRRFRALLLVAYRHAPTNEAGAHRGELLALGETVVAALDTAQIGFRLSYEASVDRRINVVGENYHGIAVVITGER